MAVYFTQSGKPHCSQCFLSLAGREYSGCCPSCGTWYVVSRATVSPGRLRLSALLLRDPFNPNNPDGDRMSRWMLESFSMLPARPGLRLVSLLLLVLGNTVLVAGLGYLAMRPFFRMVGI